MARYSREAYTVGCFDGSRFERRTRVAAIQPCPMMRILPLRRLNRLTTSGCRLPAGTDPSQWLLIGMMSGSARTW